MSLRINSVTCSNSIQVRLFVDLLEPLHSFKIAVILYNLRDYSYLLPYFISNVSVARDQVRYRRSALSPSYSSLCSYSGGV